MISPMKPRWWQVLLVGLALFGAADLVLNTTSNNGLLPLVLVLGAFVIPVSFTAYFYQHIHDRDIPVRLLTACFIIGGGLGVAGAAYLEYATLRSLSLAALIGVGFIEETAKLIFPIFVYLGWRYRHEADGLLFGVAAGMGFSALETAGYGLSALVQNQGSIASLEQTLLVRGLLSPARHAAWTGLVCAVLWNERVRAGRATINLRVLGFFLLAVALHTIWDIVNTLNIPAVASYAGMLVVAATSLGLLIARFRDARRSLPAAGARDLSMP